MKTPEPPETPSARLGLVRRAGRTGTSALRWRMGSLWLRMQALAPLPVLLASVALFVSCVGGAVWLASLQGSEQAERRAHLLAVGVLKTVETIAAQITEATRAASTLVDPAAVCGEEDLARMRSILARHSYISAIGRLDASGERFTCSTLGPVGRHVWLAAGGIQAGTRRVHRRVTLPDVQGVEYFAVSDRGVTVLVHSDVAFSILATLEDASLGAYIQPDDTLLFSRGRFDFGDVRRSERSGRPASFDGHQLVGIAHSSTTDLAAFVVFPADRVHMAVRDAQALVVPLAALLGLALSTLLFMFLRGFTSMAAALNRAIASDRVYMAYQPIVDLTTGRCVGAEALIRWKRRGRLVPPDRFIVAAEHAGIISRVTSRVVSLVAQDMAELLRHEPDLHVSINVSALDLRSGHAHDLLMGLLRTTGLPAESFWIEITETGLIEEDVVQTVERIRALGVCVAVDDFGTGYANLSVLGQLQVDLLKIDQRFVHSIVNREQAPGVVTGIIALARSLSLEMVAEGIETQAQADFLVASGVQFGQGWLFGRPGTVAQLKSQVQRWRDGAGPPTAS